MIKINYRNIFKIHFSITNHITHESYTRSRRNNTHQFHNRQLANIMQQLY